ncbi:MAG: Coenzyme F420 hydrogenase/dehydrogenase, beta subunit C-terminal domain [Promethearchaeota archaeon]|nr:MAG: Coenzyme F420 hydrogenase/dehydrogenase, beta subunit C-terminal domain [Candidatus Lokiarchaeota archaeon]
MKIKIFEDLIKEVHEVGICQQCGGCVSFCNSIENEVIDFKEPNLPPEYINRKKCLECGICYLICPQTHLLDEDLNKTFKFSDFSLMPIGFVDNIYSCQSMDKDFLKYGTDGGVVNTLINYLIEKKIIEGAIVAKTKSPFSREAIIAKSKEDLIDASGTKLDISTQLDTVQKFHTYTSSLPNLRRYKFRKLAFVGTPCQIYTIRCMQNLGIIPSENIEICLGLFCYENFFFDRIKLRQFEEQFKIKFKNIKRINIKENLIIELKDHKTSQNLINISFKELKDYMRPACEFCKDFTNIYADISFGGLGSPDKFTTVITRTKKGKDIIHRIIKTGMINCLSIDSSIKKKMKEKIIQFSQFKLERNK